MQNNKVMKELATLKEDTSKVIRDLSLLTSSLAEETESELEEAAESLQAATAEELKKIRYRLARLNTELRDRAKKTDVHIHENPYAWIAGALGIGVFAGLLNRARQPTN